MKPPRIPSGDGAGQHGLIVSTDFLARRYRTFNSNVFVCRNDLDLKRFDLTRVPRGRVNVGWSGATGHAEALGRG